MDVEIPFLAGYLNVPTQSGFPLHRISKKKTCQKYCLLFKASRYGIERLEICESKEDKNPKIVTLENCVKITQESSPANLIYIVKKTGTLTLNALHEDGLKEWVNALQTVAFRSKNEVVQSLLAIEEDNDLYCSSYGDGLFIVTLIPSEASIRCNIEPKVYMLHLTPTELQLKTTSDLNNTISNWPYRFIRKYGYRDGKFTFEAGRKCSTGEGVFTLDHTNPQEVFRCMSSKMKSMKKMISGDSVSMDSCENQLSVAASMEPGSRSPLPPSPSNQHSPEFEINSTQSSFSIRNFISTGESSSNCSMSSMPLQKIIPNKPPRKMNSTSDKTSSPVLQLALSNNGDKFRKYKSFEPVSITSSVDPNIAVGSSVILKPPSNKIYRKPIENPAPELPARNDSKLERDYESIENITDAWKTLGINDVKHNEHINVTENNDPIDMVWPRSSSKSVNASKIIDIDIGESVKSFTNTISTDVTYDRLDFLSANHKTLSSYKTIVTVMPLTSQKPANISPQNEYELINVPDVESSRKADDNYLGYGILRTSQNFIYSSSSQEHKTLDAISNEINPNDNETLTKNHDTTDEIILDHHNSNGLNYAIVGKRV